MLSFLVPLSTTVTSIDFRIYIFDFPLVAIYLLWYLRFMANKSMLNFSKLDFYFISFLILLFISSILGLDFLNSLNGISLWFRAYLIFFYLHNNLQKIIYLKDIKHLIISLFLFQATIGTIQAITNSNFGALNQYFGPGEGSVENWFLYVETKFQRVQGTLISPNSLSCWLLIFLPFFLVSYLIDKRKFSRILYLSLLIWGVIILLLTYSRGAWIAFIVGLLIVILTLRKKVSLWKQEWRNVLLAIIIFLILIFIFFNIFESILDFYSYRLKYHDKSLAKRIDYIKASFKILIGHPFFGIGCDNFQKVVHHLDFYSYQYFRSDIHNIYLLIASENGIISGIIFILIFYNLIIIMIKKIRNIKSQQSIELILTISIFSALISYLVAMLFYVLAAGYQTLPLIFIMIGTSMGICKNTSNKFKI